MSMKICSECGKSLVARKRLVNADKNGMRCRDCNEPDIFVSPETPPTHDGQIKGVVAKPNYIIKTPPQKRSPQKVAQAVNGDMAKAKHYIKAKPKNQNFHPVIDEKSTGKKDGGKSRKKKDL